MTLQNIILQPYQTERSMTTIKGSHEPKFIILQCVRWYYSYSLNYRNIEEVMAIGILSISFSLLNATPRPL